MDKEASPLNKRDSLGTGGEVVKSHMRPTILYGLPMVVAIVAVFAPWFSWQRRDRQAEASQVYESTTLFAISPSANYEMSGTSDDLLTVDEDDHRLASGVGLFGWFVVSAVCASVALRARMASSEGARFVAQLALLAFVALVLCSCTFLMFSGVRLTDMGQDQDEWRLVALNWVGPGLLMISGSMAALIWAPSPVQTLRSLLLIELGLAVVLWFGPILLKTGLTLWSGVFLPQLRNGQVFRNPARQLAFVSNRNGNREIYLVEADRTGLVNLTHHRSDDFDPSWSPDGHRIAFVSNRSGNLDVFTMKADGSDLLRLTDNSSDDLAPAWSLDGRWIAFTSGETGRAQVYIILASGGLPIQVTRTDQEALNALWQPDNGNGNHRIAFEQCAMAGETNITKVKEVEFGISISSALSSPSDPTDLSYAIGCSQQQCPSRASYNGKVVYVSDRTYNFEAYQESPRLNLTRHPANDICPSLSSDGELLAFASQRDGNWEIYVTEIGSSDMIRLTYSLAVDTAPVWRP